MAADEAPATELVDIAIIGGGAAGMTAGIYASRAMRRTVLWERAVIGGQIATTSLVENYPGFPEGVQGPELSEAMHKQAERFGLETRYGAVTGLRREGMLYRLETDTGQVLARAVILTAGAEPKKLGVPGEQEFTGKGVSYCATCDAAFFRDEVVAIVGGGDAALDEALFTTRFASKVYVIHRRDELRAQAVLQDRAFRDPKIEFIWDTVVERVNGTEGQAGGVRSLSLRNVKTDATSELEVTGMFVFIGQIPNSELIGELVVLDGGGHAHVNLWMETAQPGLFVAGDVRVDSARQLVAAAGDGATAAIRADRYLDEHSFE